ncbi:Uncharacterized membrane protein YckC, RDD family [Lampropedia hyalina DSM 16112]|jgi:uncharacterized RDD family membrane protein YckC|uniref:Uncharacterized membrane protein YckC, RDD family n=1 Tax=Lampropedia hyalina DSM 16112 TaxID=1122156 RepID=A0A1M4VX81_9BURK|nr:RDD family protein [Lampropedia hyalina]SHE73568.1 Uncharacterized membrane protein YckC, RDD family [Lampropedia hyalina DSM 16112]
MNSPFNDRDLRDLQQMAGPQYAGFWIRVAASIIDSLLIACLTTPLAYLFYGAEYWSSDDLAAGPVDVLLTWVLPAVAVVLFWLYRQATPGKMLFGLRVVDARSGATLGVGQAIGRYLAYFVAAIPLLLGLIWVAFDGRKQGWHDKLAGTVVVKKD